MSAIEVGQISVVWYSLLGAVLALSVLVGAFVAPHVSRPILTFRRSLFVGGVLMLVGTITPTLYVAGYQGLINVVYAVLTYSGLAVVGFGFGVFAYYVLWVGEETLRLVRALAEQQVS